MTNNPASCQSFESRRFVRSSFVLLSCAALLGGCGVRKRPAIPWATAVLVRPVVPARTAQLETPPAEPIPELRLDVPPPNSHLTGAHEAPPRPRGPAGTSATNEPEKPEAPVVAPQLTIEATVVGRQQTNQSLAIAEKNLASIRGKSLNAAQADLVSKIKGFITDAREAAHNGDWTRAGNLAQKAQVLSEELVSSF